MILAVFFVSVGWAVRGSFKDAGDDLRNANPALFVLGCAALAAYYLVFVFGWMRILADWDIQHLVSGRAAGRDGLDAREVRARRRLDAGRTRRRSATRGHHRCAHS